MDRSPPHEHETVTPKPRGTGTSNRSPRTPMLPGSPLRKVSTGMEDTTQLQWLVEKLAKELADSKKREATIADRVSTACVHIEELQGQMTALWQDNAALKAKLAAEVGKSLESSSSLQNRGHEDLVPSACKAALEELQTWFDDRVQLQAVIESQQEEISRLTATVQSLGKIVEGTHSAVSQATFTMSRTTLECT
ncbi:hypothetical protein DIPPA_29005 [Diplonema papillatum]|nr:hypothetical protein DIPPA_29005 [Diplonema papillatum]